MPSTRDREIVAAVDLGSNSFHMIVARHVGGHLRVLDRLRERVVLADGLDTSKRLTREAESRAIACLERFGQRLRHVPRGAVRAVGTNTLRQARDTRAFLARAEEALGHPIEVISGSEEARLIYLGVARSQPDQRGKRLVVDIGGGSTECILGRRFEAQLAHSFYMGCVTWSRRFFPGGFTRDESFEAAQLAARLELETIERSYRDVGWDVAIGSSGTILAVHDIIRAKRWGDGITREGLERVRGALESARQVRRVDLPGVTPERAEVLPGGVAILAAAFDAFGLERMAPSTGALREGLLHDLIGRMGSGDVRSKTIDRASRRHGVDLRQAARVERTALACLEQVRSAWGLDAERDRQVLSWASRLHEIGMSLSYSGYHKHGAYLVEHSDLPGFSYEDQEVLAAIIRGHRRKLSPEAFAALPPANASALRLCVLLRLAVRLNRSRSPRPVPAFKLAANQQHLALVFAKGWLSAHPLTRADLIEEAQLLRWAGFQLSAR